LLKFLRTNFSGLLGWVAGGWHPIFGIEEWY